MFEHSKFKLGRSAVKLVPRHRRLSSALFDILPPPPDTVDNTGGVSDWGMMLNDSLGDCTIAGLGHSIQVASLAAGTEETVSDDVIEEGYETLCGYNPSDSSTDQ